MKLHDLTVGSPLAIRVLEGTADHWRTKLSLEQWKQRHEIMRGRFDEHNQDTRVFAFFDDDGAEFLAGCDVWKRPAVIKDGKSDKVRYIYDYVLSSVFVHPDHRRQGLAEGLVSGVVKVLQKEDPDAFISLWSDVGNYYSRSGFKLAEEPGSCLSILLKAAADDPWPSGVQQLTRSQALDLAEEHKRLIVSNLEASEGTKVAVLPGAMPFDHFMLRGEISATAVGVREPIEVYGARTQNQHGWAVWSTDFNFNHIYVLAIYGSADEIAELCAAACAAASTEVGLFDVELYPTSLVDVDVNEVLAAVKARGIEAKIEQREGSWPMSLGPCDDVEWVYTGKYAWF